MIQRRLLLAAAAVLAGCQLPGSGDPPQLYTLTPKNTFSSSLPRLDVQLMVDTPVAAAGLNSSRIAIQRSPVRLDYYARAAWTDPAPLMIQTLLIESFENTKRIVSVSRESTQIRPDYILQLDLREFQAEQNAGDAPPQARARLVARLVRMPDRVIVASTSSEATQRAAAGDIDSVVLAFDEAAGKVLRQTVEWTMNALGAARRASSARPG